MSDLISRSALLEKARVYTSGHGEFDEMVEVSDVKNAPAVDAVEVVHGRWEKVIPTKSAAKWSTKVSCSICHKQGYARHNYCPNCGAKMDGERNDDE